MDRLHSEMESLAQIRPRLKQGSIFWKVDAGVFFPGDGSNGSRPFLLKGGAAAEWITRLAPYLDGRYTLAELCRGLRPEQVETLVRLVHQLLEKGVIKNYLPEDPALLSRPVRRRFRPQIEYIDHYVDKALERFKSFREARLLLIGAGESYLALARALIGNGLQALWLAPTDQAEYHREALERDGNRYRESGLPVNIELVACASEEILELVSECDYDLVVYCADQGSAALLARLNQCCLAHGRRFLPALIFGGQAVLGPLVQPPAGPCWLCAQLRLTVQRPAELQASLWRALVLDGPVFAGNSGLFTPVARRIGNSLAFEIFKMLTEALPPETEHGLIIQNLETLESVHCPLLQHPLCPLCTHPDLEAEEYLLTRVVNGEVDGQGKGTASAPQVLSPLVNEHTGPFSSFEDDQLPQLPLKVARLTAAMPTGSGGMSLKVITASLESVEQAHIAALGEMVAAYAQLLPDRRRMRSATLAECERLGLPVVPPARLAIYAPLPADENEVAKECQLWMPAFALFARQICYVPAAAVYPGSLLNSRGIFERTAPGSVAGTTFAETLRRGLYAALSYEYLRDLLKGHKALKRLQLAELEPVVSSRDLKFLIRCALHCGEPVSLFEVVLEGPFHQILGHVPTCAGEIMVCGSGLSAEEALTEALRELLAALQLAEAEGRLPPRKERGLSSQAPWFFDESARSRWQQLPGTLADLEEYLRAGGREILFVHTTPCDLWQVGGWICGTVLLTRALGNADQPMLSPREQKDLC